MVWQISRKWYVYSKSRNNNARITLDLFRDIQELVALLQKSLIGESVTMVVRRNDFLEDTLRKCRRVIFDPLRNIEVCK